MESADTPGLLMTVNVTFNVPLLAIVIGVVLVLLVYAGVLRYRHWRLDQRTRRVADLITRYFREHGQEVMTHCFAVLGGRRFVAVVESPPVKRFRYSHIVESSLIQHLQKTAGVELDKIYWRFPLAWKGVTEDPYFSESQALLEKTLEDYRVEDVPWESYEQASHRPGPEETP